jgi:hypothetical protein
MPDVASVSPGPCVRSPDAALRVVLPASSRTRPLLPPVPSARLSTTQAKTARMPAATGRQWSTIVGPFVT